MEIKICIIAYLPLFKILFINYSPSGSSCVFPSWETQLPAISGIAYNDNKQDAIFFALVRSQYVSAPKLPCIVWFKVNSKRQPASKCIRFNLITLPTETSLVSCLSLPGASNQRREDSHDYAWLLCFHYMIGLIDQI